MSNDSNTNIINRRDRKTLNMKCFKLNPPFYENIKVKRREALNNPTPFLKIDNLTNYFNLQTIGQIQYEGKTDQIKRNNLNLYGIRNQNIFISSSSSIREYFK